MFANGHHCLASFMVGKGISNIIGAIRDYLYLSLLPVQQPANFLINIQGKLLSALVIKSFLCI